MGACKAKNNDTNAEIIKPIKTREPMRSNIIVLGTQCSGKSTLIRQINGKYMLDYSENMIRQYILYWIDMLASVADELSDDYQYIEPKSENETNIIKDILYTKINETWLYKFNLDNLNSLHEWIQSIWNLKYIQNAYKLDMYHTICNDFEYFMNRTNIIFDQEYKLDYQDVIRLGKPTRHPVWEVHMNESLTNGDTIVFYEIGGYPATQRKYANNWNDYKLVIFVASLNQYIKDPEIYGVTYMNTSICYFRTIVDQNDFKDVNILLVLTKLDLFKESIKKGYSLSLTFGDLWNRKWDYIPIINECDKDRFDDESFVQKIVNGYIIDTIQEFGLNIPLYLWKEINKYVFDFRFKECWSKALQFIQNQYESNINNKNNARIIKTLVASTLNDDDASTINDYIHEMLRECYGLSTNL